MLSRLMVKVGGGDTKVTTASAAQPGRRGVTPTPAVAQEQRNAVLQNNGAGPLVVNDSFDRAWRRVGLALDRVGFTVEDRDRSKGLFYVRYIDPERDLDAGKPKESWTDKLKFWKSTPKEGQPQFRIYVADAGSTRRRCSCRIRRAPRTIPRPEKDRAALRTLKKMRHLARQRQLRKRTGVEGARASDGLRSASPRRRG